MFYICNCIIVILYIPRHVVRVNKSYLILSIYAIVTGHKTVTMGVVDRCPSITKESSEKIQNAMREVSKGDCIVMGDFNHGNIQWDTLESTGV